MPAAELIYRAELVGMPAIILGELRAGFQMGGHRQRTERELAAFLANPAVEVLTVDGEASQRYADIVTDLRQQRSRSRPTTCGSPPRPPGQVPSSSPMTSTSLPFRGLGR